MTWKRLWHFVNLIKTKWLRKRSVMNYVMVCMFNKHYLRQENKQMLHIQVLTNWNDTQLIPKSLIKSFVSDTNEQ